MKCSVIEDDLNSTLFDVAIATLTCLRPSQYRELLAQREILGDQVRARAKSADERADDCCEKLEHPTSFAKGRRVCQRRFVARDAVGFATEERAN